MTQIVNLTKNVQEILKQLDFYIFFFGWMHRVPISLLPTSYYDIILSFLSPTIWANKYIWHSIKKDATGVEMTEMTKMTKYLQTF